MDRNQWLGDPDFVKMPLDRLLSAAYASQLRAQILPDRASPTPPFQTKPPESGQTTHYSVVDDHGNAVSVTTTLNNGFGSAVTVTGGGFLLNDEMDDFATAPGKPNMYGLVQGEQNAVAASGRHGCSAGDGAPRWCSIPRAHCSWSWERRVAPPSSPASTR